MFFLSPALTAATAADMSSSGKSPVITGTVTPCSCWALPSTVSIATRYSPDAKTLTPPTPPIGIGPCLTKLAGSSLPGMFSVMRKREQPESKKVISDLDFPLAPKNINIGWPFGTGNISLLT